MLEHLKSDIAVSLGENCQTRNHISRIQQKYNDCRNDLMVANKHIYLKNRYYAAINSRPKITWMSLVNKQYIKQTSASF